MTVIVVVIDESKDSLIKRRTVFLRLDVNIVMFYRSPKSFYPDVVLCPAPAVHTDLRFRIPGAVCIRNDVVVFLRQRVNAGEDAIGCLEAGAAVVPVYAKERLLEFLPGIKVVSISRICNRNEDGLSSAIRRFLYKTPRFQKFKIGHAASCVAIFHNYPCKFSLHGYSFPSLPYGNTNIIIRDGRH